MSDWIERLLVKDPTGTHRERHDAWDELEEIVIDVLGPRWRRDARLVDRDVLVDTPKPLTPAPFASTHTRTPTPGSHPSAPPPVAEESVDVGGQPQDQEYEEASDLETPAAPSADETEAPTEEPRVEAAPEAPPTPAAESSIEPPAERSEFVTFARSAREPVEELPQPEPAAPASQPATPVPVPVPVSPPDDALARTVEPKAPPPPPAPPPPHRAPSDPSRVPARRRRAALLVGIAVLFAVVGFVVAPSKTQKQRALPPLSHTATSTAFSLAYPEHLTLVHESVNLGLADPMALASSEDPSKIIAAGRMAAVGPSLLPHGLRAQLSESPVPDRIRLSALQALRYNNLRPAGSSLSLRVYAVPTSAGVVGIVCSAPPGASGSFASECERIAQTLKLRSGARGFPVGPSASYAAALGKATKLLAVERQPALKRLSAARTPRRQARDARAVASAYAGVAGILGGLKLSPYDAGANNALVAALTGARRSYSRLAEAAKASDHPGYRDAKRAVARAERAVIGTIPTFTALGYEVKQ